jgi:hypothetical protein
MSWSASRPSAWTRRRIGSARALQSCPPRRRSGSACPRVRCGEPRRSEACFLSPARRPGGTSVRQVGTSRRSGRSVARGAAARQAATEERGDEKMRPGTRASRPAGRRGTSPRGWARSTADQAAGSARPSPDRRRAQATPPDRPAPPPPPGGSAPVRAPPRRAPSGPARGLPRPRPRPPQSLSGRRATPRIRPPDASIPVTSTPVRTVAPCRRAAAAKACTVAIGSVPVGRAVGGGHHGLRERRICTLTRIQSDNTTGSIAT